MKKIMMILMIAIAASSTVLALTKMSKDKNNSVETQIIALEKAGWEAWKNKDAKWYQTNLTEDYLLVNSEGVRNKTQTVKSIASECEVKSYSLDNFKFVMLDKNTALLTYTGMQDAVCNGKTMPATVRSSAVYVKRGGKWLDALYMETPTVQ